jgi:hypothetical protein
VADREAGELTSDLNDVRLLHVILALGPGQRVLTSYPLQAVLMCLGA